MKKLNSPYLALIVLISFLALCYRVYPPAPQELTYPAEPASKQEGYDRKDIKKMDRFIAFQLKQFEEFETAAPKILEIFNN